MPDLEVARLEPLSASHRAQLWAWIGNREWFEKVGRAFAETLQAKGAVTMSTTESESPRFIDWTCTRPECANVQTTLFKGVVDVADRIAACSRCRMLYRFRPASPMLPPLEGEPFVPVPLVGPNGEYVTVGPVAFQRMHLPAAVNVPKVENVDGGP